MSEPLRGGSESSIPLPACQEPNQADAESLQAQVESYLTRLDALIQRGRHVRAALLADASNETATRSARIWQEDCGVTINQLSGGSKAHWLARSFSEAFLMRSAEGHAVAAASPAEIIQRLIGVLEQAVASVSRKDQAPVISTAASPEPPPRRFDFVHNAELRPIVEQAYTDSRRALDEGDYDSAMRTSCGILEALVTDALEHRGLDALAASGAPSGKIADWSFENRLAVAEKAGLIRCGCARLPVIARSYRKDNANGTASAVTERDARLAAQVLRVIMRDLNPTR